MANEIFLRVQDYDLAATLDSGQVFRWQRQHDSWVGVIGKHYVRLTQTPVGIHAVTGSPVEDWHWLRQFLQTEIDVTVVLKTFPDDEPMRAAIAASPGLRLLKQDPWECLASFILSSTKQIVQIRQIVAHLCERFGEPLNAVGQAVLCPPPPANQGALMKHDGAHGVTRPTQIFSFPTPQQIAAASEAELRACKMGFRAPSLLAAARQIADGEFDLEKIRRLDYAEARAEQMKLRGVGGTIADCI